MTLNTLRKVIMPPTVAYETGDLEAWRLVEEAIGTILPNDYKQYINTFGTGCIGGFLWPFNPFSKNEHLNLVKQVDAILAALRELGEKWEEQCPYSLHPQSGGLLPWGITDNGDTLFWLMDGHPDEWPVVINESRAPVYEKYEVSMTTLLTKLLSGEIVSRIFPDDFPDKDAPFVPFT